MKYGIITHYDVHNHGAILQLNGLIQAFKSLGVKAKALQFDKNYDFMGREWKAKYEVGIKSVGIYIKFLFERGLMCTIFNYVKKVKLDRFKHSAQLVGDYYTDSGELDGIAIGSDEVFALHTGLTPVFFGHALPSNKVFAYGGCFGPTTIMDIDRLRCRAVITSGLQSMCGLGMRDQNSIEIARMLTGKIPELVCDPVILYGYGKELAALERPVHWKYLVVYSYDKRMNEPKEVAAIKEYAGNNGLKIVSPGFFHKWADKCVNVGPMELLGWFKYAECVVTDTFHGCVMSIITEREMVVKLRDNANKLYNLMTEYNIADRVIDDSMQLDEVFSRKVNWESVEYQINNRRAQSMDYLKRMIAI